MRIRVICMALACSACDALVPGDYAGDPVLRLQAVATSGASNEAFVSGGVLGAALWQGIAPDGATAFSRLALDLTFPAFTIEILDVPEPAVVLAIDGADGEAAIAEAYLHIVAPDTGARPAPADFIAADFDHALAYVTAQPAEGSLTAQYLGGSLSAGFHVMDRTPMATLSPAQEVLVARCVAAATALTPSQAVGSCTARRLYQLRPSRDDLATVLQFRPETMGGP